MVHSADSRIQGHAFRCHLFSPAVRDHASTNPASFSPWARPQAQRCSTTKALPNHRASGWTCSSIHCLPREVRGQKKTVPSLRTRTSGYSGQVATNCSWMRAPFVEHASGDQNRKSAFVSGAVVETVCTLCHISLSAYHRALQKSIEIW